MPRQDGRNGSFWLAPGVTFGRDGEPFYINGPRDDTYGTLAKLRQTAGDGKFHYLIQFPGPGY